MRVFTQTDLEELPTIHSGQYSDLKIEALPYRVWLSRLGPEDGEAWPVQVEQLIAGKWAHVTPDCSTFHMTWDEQEIEVRL